MPLFYLKYQEKWIRLMTNSQSNQSKNNDAKNDAEGSSQKRPYSAPRILSVEPLEAVATVCVEDSFPSGAQFGKDLGCVEAGS